VGENEKEDESAEVIETPAGPEVPAGEPNRFEPLPLVLQGKFCSSGRPFSKQFLLCMQAVRTASVA
jgi:hypothetical protein